MDKDEFRQWIYDNYNVPGDNCTLAPAMLDGILDYAENMEGGGAVPFLLRYVSQPPGERFAPGKLLRGGAA